MIIYFYNKIRFTNFRYFNIIIIKYLFFSFICKWYFYTISTTINYMIIIIIIKSIFIKWIQLISVCISNKSFGHDLYIEIFYILFLFYSIMATFSCNTFNFIVRIKLNRFTSYHHSSWFINATGFISIYLVCCDIF
jgi:hypothetical protein